MWSVSRYCTRIRADWEIPLKYNSNFLLSTSGNKQETFIIRNLSSHTSIPISDAGHETIWSSRCRKEGTEFQTFHSLFRRTCEYEIVVSCSLCIVTWRLKAGIEEPVRKSVPSQRLAKHKLPLYRYFLLTVTVTTTSKSTCPEGLVSCNLYIVTWRLKAEVAEPVWKSIASQRLAKHLFPLHRHL
jgi:hypothetical protein